MINKYLSCVVFLLVWFSNSSIAGKASLPDVAKTCQEIRKNDGWLDATKEHSFFKENLLKSTKVIESSLLVLCKEPSTTVEKICQATRETIAKAQVQATHTYNSHIFYHVLLIKLVDLINQHAGLLSVSELDEVWNIDVDEFISFTQEASFENVLKLQRKLIGLFESDKDPEEVLSIYTNIRKNELVNFSRAEWIYEYCRRLINSNYCSIHTTDELDEEDINYYVSRQVAPIGVVTKSIKYDGRSSGPWGFADHDFDCHVKLMKNNADELFNKYISSFAEKHSINTNNYINTCKYRPKELPVGPWLPLQQFYDAIFAIEDATLKKKLNLGFFVAHHENYRLFDDLRKYRGRRSNKQDDETGAAAYRWRKPHDLSSLLPPEIDRNNNEMIENYVLDVEKTFCTFRTSWFLPRSKDFSSGDLWIYDLWQKF